MNDLRLIFQRIVSVLTALWIAFAAQICEGSTVNWKNPSGGLYSDAANWSPNGLPSSADTVAFTNSGAYTLAIDVGVTNAGAFFCSGTITQAITPGSWFLTNEWRVGEQAGSTAQVIAVSGELTVTNKFGTAIASIGRAGTGKLEMAGGSLVADFLQASLGDRSVLICGDGTLTTLHGSSIQLLTLGTTPGKTFTWNINGGTNTILNTLLKLATTNGRAILNIDGPGTLLSVRELDTCGSTHLCITGGAVLKTGSVGLGTQSGSNNVVIISDPESAWDTTHFEMDTGGTH